MGKYRDTFGYGVFQGNEKKISVDRDSEFCVLHLMTNKMVSSTKQKFNKERKNSNKERSERVYFDKDFYLGLEKTTHHLIQVCFFSILYKGLWGWLKEVVWHIYF